MSHTREPWRVFGHGEEYSELVIASPYGEVLRTAKSNLSLKDANRIVACVNALEGISSPERTLELCLGALEMADCTCEYGHECLRCSARSDLEMWNKAKGGQS